MATDQLTMIPFEDFAALKDFLSHHFPSHLLCWSTIDTLMEWQKTYGTYEPVQLYTLNKDWRHDGLFLMKFHGYLYVHSMAHDMARIKRALMLWDWSKPWVVSFQHHEGKADFEFHHIMKELNVAYEKTDCEVIYCSPEAMHDVTKKYPVPDSMVLKPLTMDDMPTIMKVQTKTDPEVLKVLIERNPSYGLFDKASKELMGWCFMSVEQFLLDLFVMEGAMDMGYENVLAAALAQDRVAMGKGTTGLVPFHAKYFTDILYDGKIVGKLVTAKTEAKM